MQKVRQQAQPQNQTKAPEGSASRVAPLAKAGQPGPVPLVSPQASHRTGLQELFDGSARMVAQRKMSNDVARSARVLAQRAQHEGRFGTVQLAADNPNAHVEPDAAIQASTATSNGVVQRVPDLQPEQAVRFYDMPSQKVKEGRIVSVHGAFYRLVPVEADGEAGADSLELMEKHVFPAETSDDHILKTRASVPNTILGGWLGDAYLHVREQQRPARPNDALCGYSENCLLVAVGAIVGKTTTEVASDLGYGQPEEQDALTLVGPEVHARYENSSVGMKPKAAYISAIMEQEYGTLAQYVAKEVNGNLAPGAVTAAEAKYNKLRYENWKNALPGNDLVLPHAIDYVRKHLDDNANIRFGGSPGSMLAVENGVKEMKRSPPGTQYIVYMEGERGRHYVYADNFAAAIRFIDYQPWHHESPHKVPARVSKHPTSLNEPTPSPDVSEQGKPQSTEKFTHICFVAFEPLHAHVLATIKHK
jgi:hypothetical protein